MRFIRLFSAVLLLCGVAMAQGARRPSSSKPTFEHVWNNSLSGVEQEFVEAADAMPADKYSYAPTQGEFKGVRNFGEQVRHVAATNYLLGAALLGEAKPPVDTAGESGPASLTSKAEIMKYLKDSFAYLHKGFAKLTSEQSAMAMTKSPFGPNQVPKLSLAVLACGHPYDHYGQMVEYLRANNIIPPASRPRKR